MNEILFWVLLPYDALVVPPYFWVKVALGIATGFFIPSRIVGLLACALGNAAIFAYAASAFGHSAGTIANLTSPSIAARWARQWAQLGHLRSSVCCRQITRLL
jgi:hypothetical protein